jgi:hypothetical protein
VAVETIAVNEPAVVKSRFSIESDIASPLGVEHYRLRHRPDNPKPLTIEERIRFKLVHENISRPSILPARYTDSADVTVYEARNAIYGLRKRAPIRLSVYNGVK